MNQMNAAEIRAAVDHTLKTAGLPVTDEERARLEASYPFMRTLAESLRIPDVRYGEPALIYSATSR